MSVNEFKETFINVFLGLDSYNSPTAAISEASAHLGDNEELAFLTKSQCEALNRRNVIKTKRQIKNPSFFKIPFLTGPQLGYILIFCPCRYT